MGRPSKFKPETIEQTVKLCRLGATDADLADFFEVSEATIGNWKHAHPEFVAALRKGKAEADADVADSLYQRAMGYEHDEEKIFLHEGRPVRIQTRKKYAPDTVAAIFWLKNRRPDLWRDKQDVEHSGEVAHPILNVIVKREQSDT